jgi:glycosyltransferase involved in cell wall biosynthesis
VIATTRRRLLLATDAWHPQINGVVRTLDRLRVELTALGVDTHLITPDHFTTFSAPWNRHIKLAYVQPRRLRDSLPSEPFDFVHVATEGAVGLMTRQYCVRRRIPFTTSYHTRLPDYVALRVPIRPDWVYRYERWFHRPAAGIMVHSPMLAAELASRGFVNVMPWSRGVDSNLFHPRNVRLFGSEAPTFLYVGRVALEKNVEAFLRARLPGRKVVVGDGPRLEILKRRYRDVTFTGWLTGRALAAAYASADVLVFPSRTDVFANVILEALASGTPVAAYPVPGAVDVLQDAQVGITDEDLAAAAVAALAVDRRACERYARAFSWRACAEQFLCNIASGAAAATGE